MAITKSSNGDDNNHFHVGEPVDFNYRGAHDIPGTIKKILKPSSNSDDVLYAVEPEAQFIHPGEKVPVHRTGASLHKRTT